MRSLLFVGCLWASLGWAGEVVVVMKDNRFQPGDITISEGTTVRWVNEERRTSHDVVIPELDVASPRLFPEEAWSYRFDQPGTYHYHCQPHENRGMTGIIHVTEED